MANKTQNGMPAFKKIYETLKGEILSGAYAETMKLPPGTELAARFGIARNTLRRSLALLREDGLTKSQLGIGEIVVNKTMPSNPVDVSALGKPTSESLANVCGVSRGTVFRALSGKGYVRPEIKKLVFEKAKELGYTPNTLARSLKSGVTNTIGVVVFDLVNPFFSSLVNEIERAAREEDYSVTVMLTHKDPDDELECVNKLIAQRVDAIIIDPVNKAEAFGGLNAATPIIAAGNKISDDYPFVGINDFEAEKDAVGIAWRNGYRSFVFVCAPLSNPRDLNIWAPSERHRGFVAAMEEHGIAERNYMVCTDGNYMNNIMSFVNGTYGSVRRDKVAILCSSDIFAIDILTELKRRGHSVPKDIGVMGFDDINISAYTEPRLTTVNHSIQKMGEAAFHAALCAARKIDADKWRIIPHEIVVGGSL